MISVHTSPIDAALLSPFSQNVLQRYHLDTSSHAPFLDLGKVHPFDPYFLVDILNVPYKKEFDNIKTLRSYEVPTLIDYLRKSHEEYLNKRLPEIEQSLDHLLSGATANRNLSLVLGTYFTSFKEDLYQHIALEEEKLFPYALGLYQQRKEGKDNMVLTEYSAMEFLKHHDHSELEAKTVKTLFETYQPEKTSQSPYRVLMKQLESFAADMEVHELLEDNVLVAKLLELESL